MNYNILKPIVLFLFFNLVGVSTILAFDDPFENGPYLEGTEYELDSAEYEDLKSYMERVPEMLKDIISNSKAYRGIALREFLIKGIKTVLDESGAGTDLMLFRYNLSRALVVDELFNASCKSKDSILFSNRVLLSMVSAAMEYYNKDDVPRIESKSIAIPDWENFAASQISLLIQAAIFSPTIDSEIEDNGRSLCYCG